MSNDSDSAQITSSMVEFCQGISEVWRGGTEEPSNAGTEYSVFLKELLEAEEKRSTGMETRALAVVTSSGALVTLLLALAALVTRVQQAVLPGLAFVAAIAAAALLVASAVCAGFANAPWRGWGLKPARLRTELWDRWGNPADVPVAKVAATRLKMWEATYEATQRKAKLVFGAALLQAAGALALTVTIIAILS